MELGERKVEPPAVEKKTKQPTIIRLKRKRNEAPEEALIIAQASKRTTVDDLRLAMGGASLERTSTRGRVFRRIKTVSTQETEQSASTILADIAEVKKRRSHKDTTAPSQLKARLRTEKQERKKVARYKQLWGSRTDPLKSDFSVIDLEKLGEAEGKVGGGQAAGAAGVEDAGAVADDIEEERASRALGGRGGMRGWRQRQNQKRAQGFQQQQRQQISEWKNTGRTDARTAVIPPSTAPQTPTPAGAAAAAAAAAALSSPALDRPLPGAGGGGGGGSGGGPGTGKSSETYATLLKDYFDTMETYKREEPEKPLFTPRPAPQQQETAAPAGMEQGEDDDSKNYVYDIYYCDSEDESDPVDAPRLMVEEVKFVPEPIAGAVDSDYDPEDENQKEHDYSDEDSEEDDEDDSDSDSEDMAGDESRYARFLRRNMRDHDLSDDDERDLDGGLHEFRSL